MSATTTTTRKMKSLTTSGLVRILQAAQGKSGVIILLSVNRRYGSLIAQHHCDWYDAFCLINVTDAKGIVRMKCCGAPNGATMVDSPSGRWII